MIPPKVNEAGFDRDLRRSHNALLEHVKTLTPLPSHGVEIDRTANGFHIKPKVTADNSTDASKIAPRWG